jgi:hypothetical protein
VIGIAILTVILGSAIILAVVLISIGLACESHGEKEE